MKNSWIFPVAALVVGAAGGYISGKSTSAGDEAAALEESARRTRSATRTESATSASGSTGRKNRANPVDIARMPGNSTRVQALLEFYAGLSAEQLAEEATKLDALPMSERIMASFLLFGRWAEVDPTAAMAFSSTMGMAGGFVRPTILQSWASVDPANAAKYYGENPREFAMMDMMGGRGPMGGQGASSIIATEWARQDPAAAMEWASTLTSGKGEAMSSVIGEVAKTDPRKAADMIGKLDADDQAGAYRSVAAQYGALDFAEAQTWIRSLPAAEQADALASAIGGLSNNDPTAAVRQLDMMEDGEAKNRVIDDVVGNLARVDPVAASEFLKKQTDEDEQREGMRELMPVWTAQNPVAALAYVNSFEPGPVRDSAAQAWIWGNSKGEPSEMVKLAETIVDNGDRERSLGIGYMRWMREDADAAKASIASSPGLSDEAKQRISEGRGMWGGDGGRRNRNR